MQTKFESMVEKIADIGSGFIIAWAVYEFVILAYEWVSENGFLVTCIFTVISLVRSYLWRRYFNKLESNHNMTTNALHAYEIAELKDRIDELYDKSFDRLQQEFSKNKKLLARIAELEKQNEHLKELYFGQDAQGTERQIQAEGIEEMLDSCGYIDSEDYHGSAIDVEEIKKYADKLRTKQ